MKFKVLLMVFIFLSGWVSAQNPDRNKNNDDLKNVKNERKQVTKLIESIVGTWQLSATLDKNKKNQPTKDTVGLAWIEFKADGKYRSGANGSNGTMQPVDSGSYRLNEQQEILYLEASTDKGQISHPPAEWSISVKKDVMTLEGMGSGHAQRYRYVYNKTKEGLSTNP
jgi:hypothetical protein